MTYHHLLLGDLASLLFSSSALAAGNKGLYSCKDVEKVAQQQDKQSQLNFVQHTMPLYVQNLSPWKQEMGAKFQWIYKNYPRRSGLFIFNILNAICKNKPADYTPQAYPLDDMYFYAFETAFNALQPQ